ncbi:Transcriptional activator spt7 [Dimargaris cristalligena]|nr:Transcriptional activator spt7 [Dimargaris cristalligena]
MRDTLYPNSSMTRHEPAEGESSPWSQWEFHVARQLKHSGSFQTHLYPQEYRNFQEAVDSPTALQALLQNEPRNCPCTQVPEAAPTGDTTSDFIEPTVSSPKGLCTHVQTAFRARNMIFEQMIPLLYPADCACSAPSIDPFFPSPEAQPDPAPAYLTDPPDSQPTSLHSFLGQTDSTAQPGLFGNSAPTLATNPAPFGHGFNGSSFGGHSGIGAGDDDDDDYDNDDAIGNGFDEAGPKEVDQPIEASTEEFRIPFNAIFHTLESDLQISDEYRRRQEERAQAELLAHAGDNTMDGPDGDGCPSATLTDKASDLLSPTDVFHDSVIANVSRNNPHLKHLFHAIDSQRKSLGVSDRELRYLLTDLRTHRSKWANDERVGQEELYEGLEKTLQDLKHYGEHAQPFLVKVSRRDAPDYYEVIKYPMDLGTMSKKLKNLQYPSKAAFVHDLDLIYKNCFTYNSDPASTYRKHASYLQRKADALLKSVPDITVRDRAEVEAEEDATMDIDGDRHYASDSERSLHTPRPNGATALASAPEATTPGTAAPAGTNPPAHRLMNDTLGALDTSPSRNSTPQRGRRNTGMSSTSAAAAGVSGTPIPGGGGGGGALVASAVEGDVEPSEARADTTAPQPDPVETEHPQTLLWNLKTDPYRADAVQRTDAAEAMGSFADWPARQRLPRAMGMFAQNVHVQYETVRWDDNQLVSITQPEPDEAVPPPLNSGCSTGLGGHFSPIPWGTTVPTPGNTAPTASSMQANGFRQTTPLPPWSVNPVKSSPMTMNRFNHSNLKCHTTAGPPFEGGPNMNGSGGSVLNSYPESNVPPVDFLPEYEPESGISELLNPYTALPNLGKIHNAHAAGPASIDPLAASVSTPSLPHMGTVILPPAFVPEGYVNPPEIPLSRYPAALIPTQGNICHRLFANIHAFKEIREIDAKIWATRANYPIGLITGKTADEEDGTSMGPTGGSSDPALVGLSARNGFCVVDTKPSWGGFGALSALPRGPILTAAPPPPPVMGQNPAFSSAWPWTVPGSQAPLGNQPPLPFGPPPTLSTFPASIAPLASAPSAPPDVLPPLQLNRATAYHMMVRVVTTLSSHIGYEDLQEQAVSVITDLAVNCLLNIGRTMRLYCDKYGRRMSGLEILQHTLFENGLESVTELDAYIRDEFEKFGPKLTDLKRKLENAYIRVVDQESEEEEGEFTDGSDSGSDSDGDYPSGGDGRQTTGGTPRKRRAMGGSGGPGADEDIDFDADADALMIGDFGDTLETEDFFGFKELGLDNEYGAKTLKLPNRLLFGADYRPKPIGVRQKRKRRSHKLPYRVPKTPFPPISESNVRAQIGLLRPLLDKKIRIAPDVAATVIAITGSATGGPGPSVSSSSGGPGGAGGLGGGGAGGGGFGSEGGNGAAPVPMGNTVVGGSADIPLPPKGSAVEDDALPVRQRYNGFKPRHPMLVKRPLAALQSVPFTTLGKPKTPASGGRGRPPKAASKTTTSSSATVTSTSTPAPPPPTSDVAAPPLTTSAAAPGTSMDA